MLDLKFFVGFLTMMFNWNEQDQVEGEMWPDVTASEDHIVPHPMETEEDNLFPSDNYEKNKYTEGVISDMRSSEIKNNDYTNKSESESDFPTKEDLSSRAEIDSWLDFPDISLELDDTFNDRDDDDKMVNMMYDLTETNNLNSVGDDSMQLEFDPGIGLDNRDSDAFLDCDWSRIQDFDEIEELLIKDEPIFGEKKIDNADGFHSQSKDELDITSPSIPIPDLPVCKDQSSDEGCSSFLLDRQSEEQGSSLEKHKGNEQKMKVACEKKTKERRKNKPPSLNVDHTSNHQPLSHSKALSSITDPSRSFHASPINHPMQIGESKLLQHHKPANHTAFVKFTYPSYPYYQTSANQHRSVLPGQEVHLHNSEHHKNINRAPDSKAATIMTPQEKMEKLRRLQKLQAQLAIEQQHRQYSPQISSIDESSKNNFSSGEDESKNVLHQLQEVVEKLDMKTRCCIRDSLFRLAKSAAERSIGDRSSTSGSKIDEDGMSVDKSRNHNRVVKPEDAETDTNPIDRVVANLLFQRPVETLPRPGPAQPHSST